LETALGRRERQIMDVIYRLGKASVADVRAQLPDPPTYSAVRGMLRLLEDKSFLQHRQEGLKYVYLPTVEPAKARVTALRHLVTTFFGGSAQEAAAALLEMPDSRLSAQDRRRLAAMIKKAQQEGR
jgi:predicted transcriptional regulator